MRKRASLLSRSGACAPFDLVSTLRQAGPTISLPTDSQDEIMGLPE